MFDIALHAWPDQLPELGQFIGSHSVEILNRWEDLIQARFPSSDRTSYRKGLRDHFSQYIKKLSQDFLVGRNAHKVSSRPTAQEHRLQRWQQDWELELVVRDYQLLYHAILEVATRGLGRQLTVNESQNLVKQLQDATLEAIRAFLTFNKIHNRSGVSRNEHTLLDSCNDAVLELDIEGNIVHWNSGAEKIYGYSATSILGEHISKILPADRRLEFDRSIAMLRNGRSVPPFDTIRRRADGTDVSVSITASPVRDNDGNIQGYVSIARDISDRVRAAEVLRDALEEAERASRAKSEFLANVSHELRTPMNAIIGMTELALDEDLSPELRDYLETTRESADLLLSLVNDVLDLSKLESGRFILDEVKFSLRELIDETVRGISSRAYRKGLELACLIESDVPDQLHGDPLRLRQILTNLVGNAIKFTDEGEIVVKISLDNTSGRSCILRFSVSDTGIGISPADQERVFAPFTQADASSTRRFTGTGLGLAIASHLINCFHGQFWLKSELSVGSTFFFTVRLALADDSPLHNKQPFIRKLQGVKVLVADDNETNRGILTRLLSDWEAKPVMADSAQEALQKLNHASADAEPISVAIVDALMPEQDGFQLIEQINSRSDFNIKTILMLSSADRIAFKEKCQEINVDSVLEKPISESHLLQALISSLGIVSNEMTLASNVKESSRPVRTLNVLLAEDTPANRKVVERALAKRGHHVTSASNGREAVDLFGQHAYDVILMDVQMPSMDGFQATDAIRKVEEEDQSSKRIPIIAMTAHAMVGDRHRCLAAGMDDYISKPINIRRLIDVVENYGQKMADRDSTGEERRVSTMKNELSKASISDPAEVMDLEKALRRLDGDRSLLIDLIGFFLDDYPGLITRMKDAATAQNIHDLERASHSMKGLVANFDASIAREIAQQIESSSKQGDILLAVSLIDEMKHAAYELAEHLTRYKEQATE